MMSLNLLFTCLLMPAVMVSSLPTAPLFKGTTGKLGVPALYAGPSAKFAVPLQTHAVMSGYAAHGKYGGAYGGGLPYGAGYGYGGMGKMYGAGNMYGAGYGLGGGYGAVGYNPLMMNGMKSYKAAALAYTQHKAGGGLLQYGAYPTLGKHYGAIATNFPSALAHGGTMYGKYAGGAYMKQPGMLFPGSLPGAYVGKGIGGYGGLGYAGGAGYGYAKQAATPYGSFGMLGKTALTSYGK